MGNECWIKCNWRKPTDEELETSPDIRQYADFRTPDDNQPILLTKECFNFKTNQRERYVDVDICYIDGKELALDSGDDWTEVLAWMPYPEPFDESKIEAWKVTQVAALTSRW